MASKDKIKERIEELDNEGFGESTDTIEASSGNKEAKEEREEPKVYKEVEEALRDFNEKFAKIIPPIDVGGSLSKAYTCNLLIAIYSELRAIRKLLLK